MENDETQEFRYKFYFTASGFVEVKARDLDEAWHKYNETSNIIEEARCNGSLDTETCDEEEIRFCDSDGDEIGSIAEIHDNLDRYVTEDIPAEALKKAINPEEVKEDDNN